MSYSYTCHICCNNCHVTPSPNVDSCITHLKIKSVSQHWGRREEVYTGISWLTRRDMRNLQFQPNLVRIAIFISMQASLEKSAESALTEQLTSKYLANVKFLSEKIRVITSQQDELDSRAGNSAFKLHEFVYI